MPAIPKSGEVTIKLTRESERQILNIAVIRSSYQQVASGSQNCFCEPRQKSWQKQMFYNLRTDDHVELTFADFFRIVIHIKDMKLNMRIGPACDLNPLFARITTDNFETNFR